MSRRDIDLAGDVGTMPEAAEILTEAQGRPIAFAQTPIEQVRKYSKDMPVMLEWFQRVGPFDRHALHEWFPEALYPIKF